MLKGKTVVLGVTGSIAAYKIANLASMLSKLHADIQVLMTENATNFINPITFETLTGHKCLIDTFDRNFQYSVEHVSLAKKADVVLVAPASANVIGKIANGIADDMLTTTVMACPCKKIISPAMNTNMYENSIVQENLDKLKRHGYEIRFEKDMAGKKVLVTAGPTMEAIDPVRFISNHSTGKMGYVIARIAMQRGAEVTLVTGPTHLEAPLFVRAIPVTSAQDMFEAVASNAKEQDIIIKSAAVADYTPVSVANEKIKKMDGDSQISLKRTTDILKYLGENRTKEQFLCGFSMETENMLENSKKKLAKKNLDMVVANNLKVEGAGFGVDTNVVTLITKEDVKELPCMTKEEVAIAILDTIRKKMK